MKEIFNPVGVSKKYVDDSISSGDVLKMDIDGTNSDIEYLDFDLAVSPSHAEGRLHWNNDDGTLCVGLSGGTVALQVGQETLIRVKNDSGVDIPNGSVVYVSGSTGTRPRIDLAINTDQTKTFVLGLTTEAIRSNQWGYVCMHGLVREVDTSGMTEGYPIWLSSVAGGFTQTQPDAPNTNVFLGYVIRAHATEGLIAIRPVVIPRLTALSDVNGTALDTSGQILEWDETNKYFDFTKNINDYTTRSNWHQNGFKDISGGVPDDDILITFDNATRTLSLAPTGTDFTYCRLGYEYTESNTLTKVLGTGIAGDDGLWVFYIDSSGLSSAQNPSHDAVDDVIEKTCIVAYVQWDATNNLGKLMWEAHGMNMSPATHHWLHDNIGAVYREGMSPSNFSDIGGDGDEDRDVQFDVSEGIFYDEDIEHTVTAITAGDSFDVWYLDGSDWRWTNTDVPGKPISVGNRLAWNDSGTQVEATNRDFVLAHLFATNIMTNAGSTTREYIFIQGQFEYPTTRKARAGADVEINNLVYGTLPLQEIIPVATIILQTNNNYDNSIKSRIILTESGDIFVDWRGSDLKASGGSISDHGSLSGLGDNDHPQYVQTVNNLTDVADRQTALDNLTDIVTGTAEQVLTLDTTSGAIWKDASGGGGSETLAYSELFTAEKDQREFQLTREPIGVEYMYVHYNGKTLDVNSYHIASGDIVVIDHVYSDGLDGDPYELDISSGDIINFRYIKESSTTAFDPLSISALIDGSIPGSKIADDSLNGSKIIDSSITSEKIYGHIGGAIFVVDESVTPNLITVNPDPALTSYDNGEAFNVVAKNTNTSSGVLMNVSSLGDYSLRRPTSSGVIDLAPGSIVEDNMFQCVFDGSQFQIISGLPSIWE